MPSRRLRGEIPATIVTATQMSLERHVEDNERVTAADLLELQALKASVVSAISNWSIAYDRTCVDRRRSRVVVKAGESR